MQTLQRPTLAWLCVLALLFGCADDDDGGGGDGGTGTGSATGGSGTGTGTGTGGEGGWFVPTADMTWQWQLTGSVNTSYDVDVYDIDLFENDAATVMALHDDGRRVVCYFSAGTYEPWREDAGQFDAADIGNALPDWPDERWLDHRSPAVRAVLAARLDIARDKGCDAVEPDNVTAYTSDSGFPITAEDQLDFNRWLATEGHARGMGVALKNDDEQVAELAVDFDFSVAEECHFYGECGDYAPFLGQNKPVFNAEYTNTAAEAEALAATLCPAADAAGTRTVIFPWDLDDSFRVSCD
ncbi:MAG TPA: endo alpha-1,4 polygalactosaminidase [Polyangiaceae bacterium]|nr:endo alpha-1,4 polygalactosaminidase [Polyangiaceae bacterium]